MVTPTDGPASRAPSGAANRVAMAQAQARPTLLLAVAFVVAAAVAGLADPATGRWLPLHLFLAGGLVLAISGASLLFAVTWSAAPAPPGRLVALQRALVAVGAVSVVVVRERAWPTWALAGAAALYGAGLVVLMVLLQTTVRRGVQRRFDVAVRWYLTALASGLVGTLAAVARAGGADVSGDLRGTHLVLNVLGLVGLVIAGTLPSFLATEARVKMSPRATPARLTGLLAWQAGAVVLAAGALTVDQRELAAVGLGAYVIGLAGLSSALPGFGEKQLRWAGPRLAQLVAGLAWWAGTVLQAAVVAARGDVPFLGTTVLVLVVAGYGQILWASLAYLLPVLRGGGHERLAAGFATTRSWLALVAANAAGVALVAGAPGVATVLVAVWVVDAAVRVVRLRPLPPSERAGAARQ